MSGYNLGSFTMGRCLNKTNENLNLEDFKYSFYHKLKLYGKQYNENQYDEFLEALYQKNIVEYKKCYANLYRISFKYVRENNDLLINLINSNNIDLIQVAYDMYKKMGSIILRLLPARATKETVKKSDKKLLCDLGNLLLSIKDEEANVVANAQLEFAKFYGEYSDNEYLGEYYKSIIASFEEELINTIDEEVTKVPAIKKRLQDKDSDNASFTDKEMVEKNKKKYIPNIYRQTFR